MQQTCQAVTNDHLGTAVNLISVQLPHLTFIRLLGSSTSSQSVDTLGCKILVYHVCTQELTLDGGDISHPDP